MTNPELEYEVAGGFVRIVFKRPEGAGVVNGELNGELNSAPKATLNYIKENAGCNATEISDKTGVPFSTIDKHIRVLLKNGKIERRGSKKTGGYYVK